MESVRRFVILLLLGLSSAIVALAQEPGTAKKGQTIELAEGKFLLTAPDGWKRVEPRVRIIDDEFAISALEGDPENGRLTVTAAGGDLDENISRWVAQFSQPDGKSTRDSTKIERKTIAGQDVRLVDITGTYKDQPSGPMAGGKTVDRPDYRMIAAIVSTKMDGNYFIKFYGPKRTIADNERAFWKMVDGLKAK